MKRTTLTGPQQFAEGFVVEARPLSRVAWCLRTFASRSAWKARAGR
jgi:hypothetical protein